MKKEAYNVEKVSCRLEKDVFLEFYVNGSKKVICRWKKGNLCGKPLGGIPIGIECELIGYEKSTEQKDLVF